MQDTNYSEQLTENYLKIIKLTEKRCPMCEERLYERCTCHICAGEDIEAQPRIDDIYCDKCFFVFYVINGNIGLPTEGNFCNCENRNLKFK